MGGKFIMKNEPKVEIEYLVDYELSFTYGENWYGGSELNQLSNIDNVNLKTTVISGKKGLHLSGGSVDNSGEVSGCLLDGTYTFYANETNSYNGFMGNVLSRDDYLFIKSSDYVSKTGNELELIYNSTTKLEDEYNYFCTETSNNTEFIINRVYNIKWETSKYVKTIIEAYQSIYFTTKNENTYIKSLVVYFDPVCGEYATQMSFSEGINDNGDDNELYQGQTKIKNNKLVFMYNFGENSTLKSVVLNFEKWSKKNALYKVVKFVTGYTGIYTPYNITELSYTNNKFSDEENLKFGVSLQDSILKLYDNNGDIKTLYDNDMFFKNIQVNIYIDNILDGTFKLDTKTGTTDNIWSFEMKDALSYKLNNKVMVLNVPIDSDGQPIPKSLNWIIKYVVGNSFTLIYDDGLEAELEEIMIPVPFINGGQTQYDLLLKCCQIGLLRMFTDKNGNLNISKGV
jgi:hypothetical protein